MLPVVNGRGHPAGHEAVRRLGAVGLELGLQCAIFDRTIWSARSPNGRPYTGVHPHFDHVHFELTREAGATLTRARIVQLLEPEPEPIPEPEPVRPAVPDLRAGWLRHAALMGWSGRR